MSPLVRSAALISSVLGLVAACSHSRSGGAFSARPSAEESFSFDVTRQSQTALRLEGISGTVEVRGSPAANSISVVGVRRVEADTLADATAHLAQLDVVVDNSQTTRVVVRTVQPKLAAGRNYIVNYTVVLPPDMSVNIVHVSGEVVVRAVNADVLVSGVNGRIHVDAIVGNTILALVNGDITGSVTLPSAGQIDIGVANGDIDLQIPWTTSAQFAATVAVGNITLTDLLLSNERATPRSRSGTLGGGVGTVSLDVGSGSIAVRGF